MDESERDYRKFFDESRRDFLKYFGIGTVIVPVVAGELKTEASANLIEVPKVELVTAKPGSGSITMSEVRAASIVFEMADGSMRTLRSVNLWEASGELHEGEQQWLRLTISAGARFGSPASYNTVARLEAYAALL